MKRTTLLFLSILFLFSACEQAIETPEQLIEASMAATSQGANWADFQRKKMTAEMTTFIGGQPVNKEKQVVSLQLPDAQKTEVYNNDMLTSLILTNATESALVKFENGSYFGLNTIPKEEVALNPVAMLKNIAGELSLQDTIFQEKPVFILNKAQPQEQYIFDKATTQLIAVQASSPYGTSLTTYSDYREVDGFLMPFNIEINIPKSGYRVQKAYSEIEVNPEFEADHFKRDDSWVMLAAGQPLPDFQVPSVANQTMINNQDIAGKVTLIDFWATWCKPCIDEFPNVIKNYEKYKDQGFEVVSISLDEDQDRLRDYLKDNPFPWPHSAFLENGFKNDMAKTFQLLAIPKPILVSGQGQILAIDNEARGEYLAQQLEQLLQ